MDIQPFGGRDDGDGDGDHHYHHHRASTRGGPKMAQRGEVAASMPCHDCAGEETAKRRSLGSEQIRFLAHNITAHATARLLTSDSVAHPSTLSLQGSDQSAPHLHHHPRHPLHLSTLQPGGIGPSMASSSILQQQQQRPMSMSASLPLSQPTIAAPSALPYSSGGPSFRSNSNSNGSSNAGINANGNADATRTTVLGNANGSNVGESQNHNRPLNVLARPMPNGDHQIAWSRMLNQSDTPTILTLTAFPFRIFDLNEAAVSLLGKGCVSHSLFDYFVRENTWRPTLVSHPTLLGRAHDGEIVKVRCSGNNVYCFCKIRINGVRCPSDVAAAKGNAPDQELAGYVVYLERLDLPLHMASSVIYRSFP